MGALIWMLLAVGTFLLCGAALSAVVKSIGPLPAGEGPRPLPETRGLRVKVSDVRLRHDVTDGRRLGIKVEATVRAEEGQRMVLEYRVRFRYPNGVSVKARASRYHGPGGELVARARTRPLTNDPALYPCLWLFVPYGAFELPKGDHDLEVQFDVEREGKWLAGAKTMLRLRQPEEAPSRAAAARPACADEFAIVGTGTDQAAVCPVCSVEVTEDPRPCPRCETIHHSDCWEYNEGCTTYGCPG